MYLQGQVCQEEKALRYCTHSSEGVCMGLCLFCLLWSSSDHVIDLTGRLKESQYIHLLKYFVMQADCMLMKYGPEIELVYASIPQNVKNIMGDIFKYTISFNNNTPLPQE